MPRARSLESLNSALQILAEDHGRSFGSGQLVSLGDAA
jgi:hypothetical protein